MYYGLDHMKKVVAVFNPGYVWATEAPGMNMFTSIPAFILTTAAVPTRDGPSESVAPPSYTPALPASSGPVTIPNLGAGAVGVQALLYPVTIVFIVTELHSKTPSGPRTRNPVKTQKVRITKMVNPSLQDAAQTAAITACLEAHSEQGNFVAGDSNGPSFKMCWTGVKWVSNLMHLSDSHFLCVANLTHCVSKQTLIGTWLLPPSRRKSLVPLALPWSLMLTRCFLGKCVSV